VIQIIAGTKIINTYGFQQERAQENTGKIAQLETLYIKMRLKTFHLKYLSSNCSGYKKNI